MESQVGLEFLSDLSDESLEGQFANQKFSGLLESADFSECDSAWSETVRLLDSTGLDVGCLSRCFICEMFAGSFSTSVLASGLLCSCHL